MIMLFVYGNKSMLFIYPKGDPNKGETAVYLTKDAGQGSCHLNHRKLTYISSQLQMASCPPFFSKASLNTTEASINTTVPQAGILTYCYPVWSLSCAGIRGMCYHHYLSNGPTDKCYQPGLTSDSQLSSSASQVLGYRCAPHLAIMKSYILAIS